MPEPLAAPSSPPLSRAVIIAVLAASFMVGAFAVSQQSYGIDEALSIIVASAPSPSEAWKFAQVVSGSTLQMPLYQIYLFGWHKIFGSGEWAMRASNLPLFLLAQLAFLVLLRDRPRLALTAALLAAISPAIWMYLDETRPYLMQYAAACWFIAAIVRFSSSPHPPPATRHLALLLALAAAAIILVGSGLLGVLWTAAFLAALAWLRFSPPAPLPATPPPCHAGLPSSSVAAATHGEREGGSLHSGFKLSSQPSGLLPPLHLLIPFALIVIALLVYYAWTWRMAGAGHHRLGASLLSLPYIAYEFLGFTGFGPGKLQMRVQPVGSLVRHLPALLPLALALAVLGLVLLQHLAQARPSPRTIVAWVIALAAPSLLIIGGFVLFQHRALPRHLIPALPALILALAAAIDTALDRKSVFWRALAILVPLLWLASSLNFRWHPSHAKDNYRDAAALAAAALRDNKEVWWAADAASAYIYLTPIALEEMPGRAWAMQAPAWDDIRFKFPPRVIVISKPDIFDPQGAVARYAAENRFTPALQLQAFTIFTREGESLPDVTP